MIICQGTRTGLPETELPDLLPGDLIVSGTRAGHAAWGGALEVLRLYPVARVAREIDSIPGGICPVWRARAASGRGIVSGPEWQRATVLPRGWLR